ncbi:MAG: Glu/Leu/Phe/Val dehydrogenase [archaeon]|nr:Glu/Leu/Phe/Val dehydrogenase [archaeon]
MSTILEDTLAHFKKTCDILGINENYYRFLSKPARTVIVNCPVRMDNGKIKMFQGYRVLHSNALGPGKGGLRISPTSTVANIQGLAMIMTWKTALIGLPLGGAKGAIVADVKDLSEGELERLIRRYTASIINVIGPKTDIPSPDLNTSQKEMAWTMDTYSMGTGKTTPGVCTGKPVEIGGIVGRDKAVGWGLAYIMREFANRESEKLRDQKVVIQGIGHVGKTFAKMAIQFGAKVIGISDSTTGLYKEEGLDINDIIQYKKTNKSLKGYGRAEEISNNELLKLKCDALFPCATQNQITKDNVDDIQCRLIIEGANSPITWEADQILEEKHLTVVPDIIANSGGVISSYFEWVQDLSQLRWTIDRVSKELEKVILSAFNEVYKVKIDNIVSYRRAAYMVAVDRVIKAIKYRGVYP